MAVRTKILGFLLASILITGCATTPPFRAHPQLDEKRRTIKKVIVMPPKVDVYQLTAGGVKEKIDQWTTEAPKNIMAAIENELTGKRGCVFKFFSDFSRSEEEASNLEDTQALFDAVNASVLVHTYGPPDQLFSEKITNFDYSLGSEVKGLAEQADALLFVRGVDHISTGGRKTLQAVSMVLYALLGVAVVPQGGVTAVSIALVDADTGSILWYSFKSSGGSDDLRDRGNASSFVRGLFKDFPIQFQ